MGGAVSHKIEPSRVHPHGQAEFTACVQVGCAIDRQRKSGQRQIAGEGKVCRCVGTGPQRNRYTPRPGIGRDDDPGKADRIQGVTDFDLKLCRRVGRSPGQRPKCLREGSAQIRQNLCRLIGTA